MLRAVRKRAREWRDEECHDSSGREDGASNYRIPPINHLPIHLGDGCKWPLVKAECPRMAEVMITREVGRHRLRLRLS
jgi:hypothetical protein